MADQSTIEAPANRVKGQELSEYIHAFYVAGMTDAHLLRTYERMFSPRMGSVFDKPQIALSLFSALCQASRASGGNSELGSDCMASNTETTICRQRA